MGGRMDTPDAFFFYPGIGVCVAQPIGSPAAASHAL